MRIRTNWKWFLRFSRLWTILPIRLWQRDNNGDRLQATGVHHRKAIDQAPARLQRILLHFQRYDVKPDKEMYTADILSRAHLTTQTKDDEDLITCISTVTTSLPRQWSQATQATARDNKRHRVIGTSEPHHIEDLLTSCSTCQELRTNNQKEPMIPHGKPSYPWQAVTIDLFTWDNLNYLVIVDYYSRYWEISSLNTTTSASIVSKLKSTFARHGRPEVGEFDNGPNIPLLPLLLTSRDASMSWSPQVRLTRKLMDFLKKKTISTTKSILEKAHRDGKIPIYLAIFENGNTPVDNY